MVDGTGRVVAAYDYAAYGQVVGRYGENVPFRFLGRWGIMADHDGLYYIRARYYAPRLGFFTQPDRLHVRAPLPRFLNRYAYALDDPWNLVDEDGLLPQIIAGALIGGVIGGGVDLFRQVILEGRAFNQIDWASVGAAAVGGAVSGAIASTGIGAIPLVGGAISGAIGGGVQQVLNNVFHGEAWNKDLRESLAEGAILGVVADIGALAVRVGTAGWGAWRHGLNPWESMKTSFQRAFINPWRRAVRSPLKAYQYTHGRIWKGLRVLEAEFKVITRLENPLAPVTRQWWRFAKQAALVDLSVGLVAEKLKYSSGEML